MLIRFDPTTIRGPARCGATLLELVVTLAIGVIVLAAAARIATRHHRFHRDISVGVARLDQIGQTAALLPVELRGLAPGEGDIAAGEARDTSLQIRATLAAAVVCDTAGTAVHLAAATSDGPPLSSFLEPPKAGDSAWLLAVADSTERWTAREVIGVATETAQCTLGGLAAGPAAPRYRLTLDSAAGAGPGSPIRITRWARYSTYRANDGLWYLGYRDWSRSLGRFNTVQPVSGPFLRGVSGFRLSYADSVGNPVPQGSGDTRFIARIRLSTFSDTGSAGQGALARTRANADVSVALRNRAR